MGVFKFGHRQRALYHDSSDIPALQAGILLAQQFGNDWYVNSAAAAGGDGKSPDSAMQTLAAAFAAAASGDRIYLAPTHAETIVAASGITLSKSGITVIGLGQGTARPTLTWGTSTAATFLISGNNNVISNVRCTASIDECVTLFSITGLGNVLDRVDYFETAAAQARQFALVTGVDCCIQNSYHVQANAAAAAQAWIGLTGADRFRLLNNDFQLVLFDSATSAVVRVITTACVNVLFANNRIRMTGFSAALVSCFLSVNTTTGIVCNNHIGSNVAANTTINDMPGCYSFVNLCTNAVDTSGILDPIADT